MLFCIRLHNITLMLQGTFHIVTTKMRTINDLMLLLFMRFRPWRHELYRGTIYHYWQWLILYYELRPILQSIYELIIPISQWCMQIKMEIVCSLVIEKWWPDQVTNQHMPRQLSCHDMCKFVTWLDTCNKNQSRDSFKKDFNHKLLNC